MTLLGKVLVNVFERESHMEPNLSFILFMVCFLESGASVKFGQELNFFLIPSLPLLRKSLDGCYTRMLRAALNINQNKHITNTCLYRARPRLSDKIAARRMMLSGHCHRHWELPVSKLVLWEPRLGCGRRSQGRPTPTFVDVLRMDVGAETTGEIACCMEDRVGWMRRWEARLRTTQ